MQEVKIQSRVLYFHSHCHQKEFQNIKNLQKNQKNLMMD